jgi:hypothetical protein
MPSALTNPGIYVEETPTSVVPVARGHRALHPHSKLGAARISRVMTHPDMDRFGYVTWTTGARSCLVQ